MTDSAKTRYTAVAKYFEGKTSWQIASIANKKKNNTYMRNKVLSAILRMSVSDMRKICACLFQTCAIFARMYVLGTWGDFLLLAGNTCT